jgi:hypothetical protein
MKYFDIKPADRMNNIQSLHISCRGMLKMSGRRIKVKAIK